MKIAMIGSGAAGSVFAAYLKKGGADVTLVDLNQEHLNTIRERGLRFVEDFFGDIREEVLTGFHTVAACCKMTTPSACAFQLVVYKEVGCRCSTADGERGHC